MSDINEQMVRKVTKSRDKANAINGKALMESVMDEDYKLRLKLESSLSNQMAEKAAMITLTNENAMLRKHHEDMKLKFEHMERHYCELLDELETLQKMSRDQKDEIWRLQDEVEELRRTQGGDSNMRDMQERLMRLTEDQAQKDMKIYKMEMLLQGDSGGDGETHGSSVCNVM